MKFNEMHRRLAIGFFGAGIALALTDLLLPGIIGAGLGCLAAGAALLALGYEGKK